MIILEDIEHLIGFVMFSKHFNHDIYSEIVSLLKKEIPEGRNVMVIGSTSNLEWLLKIGLAQMFETTIRIPDLSTKDEINTVIESYARTNNIKKFSRSLIPIPIKNLIRAAKRVESNENPTKESVLRAAHKFS